MDSIHWNTEDAHADNNTTMCDYIENINELNIGMVDGTYAEGVDSDGVRYEIHVSGDGDLFNHKAEFKRIN